MHRKIYKKLFNLFSLLLIPTIFLGQGIYKNQDKKESINLNSSNCVFDFGSIQGLELIYGIFHRNTYIPNGQVNVSKPWLEIKDKFISAVNNWWNRQIKSSFLGEVPENTNSNDIEMIWYTVVPGMNTRMMRITDDMKITKVFPSDELHGYGIGLYITPNQSGIDKGMCGFAYTGQNYVGWTDPDLITHDAGLFYAYEPKNLDVYNKVINPNDIFEDIVNPAKNIEPVKLIDVKDSIEEYIFSSINSLVKRGINDNGRFQHYPEWQRDELIIEYSIQDQDYINSSFEITLKDNTNGDKGLEPWTFTVGEEETNSTDNINQTFNPTWLIVGTVSGIFLISILGSYFYIKNKKE